MRADEARSAVELAGDAVAGLSRRVHELHWAIFARSASVTPAGAAVRTVHDPVAATVYDAVARSARASASLLGRAAERLRGDDRAPLAATVRGNVAQSVLNASFGDHLAEQGSALAVSTAIRVEHRDLPVDRGSIRAAFPLAQRHVVVFLHGLGENETSWLRNAHLHRRGAGAGYPSLLEADADVTAVRVRYNTGRAIAENGLSFAQLLDDVVRCWPVAVTELTLVGHSMGGLVIRSAVAQGRALGLPWAARLQRAIYLGSPHQGSPVERAAARAERLLGLVPETVPITRVSALRSRGIKDLGHFADKLPLDGAITHYAASAGRDLLVPRSSATPRDEPVRFTEVRHYRRLNHFDLLNHPDVYDTVRAWVTDGRPTLA